MKEDYLGILKHHQDIRQKMILMIIEMSNNPKHTSKVEAKCFNIKY